MPMKDTSIFSSSSVVFSRMTTAVCEPIGAALFTVSNSFNSSIKSAEMTERSIECRASSSKTTYWASMFLNVAALSVDSPLPKPDKMNTSQEIIINMATIIKKAQFRVFQFFECQKQIWSPHLYVICQSYTCVTLGRRLEYDHAMEVSIYYVSSIPRRRNSFSISRHFSLDKSGCFGMF